MNYFLFLIVIIYFEWRLTYQKKYSRFLYERLMEFYAIGHDIYDRIEKLEPEKPKPISNVLEMK